MGLLAPLGLVSKLGGHLDLLHFRRQLQSDHSRRALPGRCGDCLVFLAEPRIGAQTRVGRDHHDHRDGESASKRGFMHRDEVSRDQLSDGCRGTAAGCSLCRGSPRQARVDAATCVPQQDPNATSSWNDGPDVLRTRQAPRPAVVTIIYNVYQTLGQYVPYTTTIVPTPRHARGRHDDIRLYRQAQAVLLERRSP